MKIAEWLELPGQKKIVTDRVANGNALLRMHNIYHTGESRGLKSVSCVSVRQIAEELLFAWTAFHEGLKDIRIWDNKTCVFLLDKVLEEGDYPSIPEESRCIRTSEELLRILNQLRMNHLSDRFRQFEESEGAQKQKVSDLNRLLEAYEYALKHGAEGQDIYDEARLLNRSIEILQEIADGEQRGIEVEEYKATESVKVASVEMYLPWIKNCRFGLLEDAELTGKERQLLDMLVRLSGGTLDELEFCSEACSSENKVQYEFFSAYGAINEVRHVADQIEKKKLPYGSVQIFYTSPEYEPFIKSVFGSREIPYRFVSGKNLADTNMVRFMTSVLDFFRDDYLYKTLYTVIDNPSMTFAQIKEEGRETSETNRKLPTPAASYTHFLRKGIGWGKERYLDCIKSVNEDEKNVTEKERHHQFLTFLSELMKIDETGISCGEFYRRLLAFAKTFSYQGQWEKQSLGPILKEQELVFDQVDFAGEEMLDYIKEHLSQLTLKENSDLSAVQVVHVHRLEVMERPYNFFIGMSAKQFETDTTESPVLSDQELKDYIVGTPVLAQENGKRLKKAVERTLHTLRHGTVVMGYSTFDTMELRMSAPSVFYLDCLEKAGYHEADIEAIGTKPFGALNGALTIRESDVEAQWLTAEGENETQKQEMQKEEKKTLPAKEMSVEDLKPSETLSESVTISSTGLQTLVKCPFEYDYHYIQNISKIEFQEKVPHIWLSPLHKGNLFHWVMEEYCNRELNQRVLESGEANKNVFDEIYDTQIELMVSVQPYVSEDVFKKEKEANRETIWKYITNFQKEMWAAQNEGTQPWRIIGSELKFNKLMYTPRKKDGSDSKLQIALNGSIDRLDGCVVEVGKKTKKNTLYLRIVDYKTGDPDKKVTEVRTHQQLQHFIYAIEALNYARDNKNELEVLFGKEIHDTVIASVQYVFPYEEKENQIFDLLNTRKQIKETKNLLKATEIRLPDMVDNLLIKTLGCLLDGEKEQMRANMEAYMTEREEALKKTPCTYCNYKRQCGRKIGTEK